METKEKYVVHFKNETTVIISKKIANNIRLRLATGASNFQTFSDENDDLVLILNLSEVVFIDQF